MRACRIVALAALAWHDDQPGRRNMPLTGESQGKLLRLAELFAGGAPRASADDHGA
jgi:hypothetical protein